MLAPGTYTLTSTLYFIGVNDVGLFGASGDRDDVVLAGPGMTNASYGAVPFGVWVGDTQNLTIANLTIRDLYQHTIILNAGTESPRISNVRLVDSGDQFIKANPDASGGGVDNGIVEDSVIEYTTTGPDSYTNGVDVHTGANWAIRRNVFRNIRAPQGQLAGPAVLMWNGSSESVAERNLFINCQREIVFGLEERTPDDHSGGVVRNNIIYRDATVSGDAAISVWDSPNTQVNHNTVFTHAGYATPIEYRFPDTTGVLITNNLVDGTIWARDGAAGTVESNREDATANMFVDADAGDLHLAPGAAAIDQADPAITSLEDFDGELRPSGPGFDIGADEFGASAPDGTLITGTLDAAAAAGSPYQVALVVTDGQGGSATAGFTWTVADDNGAPSLTHPGNNRTDAEGDLLSLQVEATDPDGDALTYGATNLPPGLTIDPATGVIGGTIAFTAAAGSPYATVLTVSDALGATATTGCTWTVTDTNRAPVLTPPTDQQHVAGDLVALQIGAADPDGDALSFTASGLPAGVTLDSATGTLAGAASAAGQYTVTVTVSDILGATDSASMTWTVSSAADPPSSVPVVVGLTQAAAEAALTAAGLSVGVVTSATSDTVPTGSVVTQSIAAGTSVAPGTAVDLGVSSGPAVNPGLDSSLVAAYAFNEQSGLVAADASGYGHLGQVSGAAWDPNGRYGGALAFDGIDDWVTIADTDALDLTGGFTLSAWVNPTVLSGWRTVIQKERPNGLAYALEAHDNTPRPAAYVNTTAGDVAASGTSALPLDTWTHLATTFDGATLRLYVNGIEVGSTAVGSSIVTSTDPLRIGGNAVWNDEFFEGLIDEVRIHSTALTAADLQSAMALPIDATPVPNVVGLTRAAAEAALAAAGLIVGTVAQAASDSVPDGAVISQNHAAGASVAPGTAVALVVSTGPPVPVTVPNVVGLAQAAAGTTLAAAGLSSGTVTQSTSDTVPAGVVISQNPAAGSLTSTGVSVDLDVSVGQASATVPDIVGLTQSAADGAITAAGLVPGSTSYAGTNAVPAGSVISQAPAAGTPVAPGSAVDRVVSTGTPPNGIPLTLDGAQRFQSMDGFGVNINVNGWGVGNFQGALDQLVDDLGSTLFRVYIDNTDWEVTNDNGDPFSFDWSFYGALYSTPRFEQAWSTLGYLNQKGIGDGIVLNFMGPGPAWMGGDTLNPAMEDEWVEMILSYAYYARFDRGLAFSKLAPFNEPDWTCEEGICVDPFQAARVLRKIAQRLDGLGLGDVTLVAPETAQAGAAVEQYIPEILADPVIMAKVDTFGFHNYAGYSAGAGSVIAGSAYPDRGFWITEQSLGDSLDLAPVDNLMNHLDAGATATLAYKGYDGQDNHHPGEEYGLGLLAYDSASQSYVPRKGFHVLRPVHRFVEPGAVRVGTSESSGSLRVYGFHNPVNGRVTILGRNTGGGDLTVAVSLINLPAVATFEVYETDAYGANFARRPDIQPFGNSFSATVSGQSVFVLASTVGADSIVVPTVVGLTQAAAEAALTAAGLSVGTVTQAASNTVPAGSVVSQSPVAASSVAPGTAVALVVSTGPAPVAVPAVVGQSQASAEAALTAAGLSVGTVTETASAIVAAGAVVSQNPVAASSVAPGTAVALVVSTGPAPVAVPAVVGLPQADAETTLTTAGLSVGTVTQAASNTVPAGSVVSQSPVAASSVAPGTAVALVVSTGPAPVAAPAVVGLTQAAAEAALTAAGLSVGIVTQAASNTVPAGSVVSQSPVAASSVALGTAVALVVSTGPAPVAAPAVVGLTQAAAEAALTAAGLSVGIVTQAASNTVPAGSVVSQSPVAASSVALGTAVALVVSTGPAPVAVPAVVGQSQASAEAALTAAGLSVGTVTETASAIVAAGAVVSQNPVAASSVAPGTAVALVVSTGPAPVAVPAVVGLPQADAETTLTTAGLSVGTVTQAASNTVPAGSVVSQSPVAASSVAPGTAVALVVSTGPAPVAAPAVVGLTQAAAEAALTAAGLSVGIVTQAASNTVPAGSVVSQSPVAASSVALGTAVALVVSTGPAPVAVPAVVGLPQADAETTLTTAGLSVGIVTQAASNTVPAGSVVSQSPVAASSVALGTAVALVVSTGPAPVAVPAVVGQSQASAEAALTAAGLSVGTVTETASAIVATGAVVSQSPVAASSVAPGTAVALVVSTGPAPVAVPAVVGLTQAAAEAALTAAGLSVGIVTQAASNTVPAGSVVSQSPVAASSVALGTAVALVVSTGPAPVAVPAVVGQSQASAEAALTAAGLSVGTVTETASDTVPPGSVVSQSPVAASSVAPGTAVALVVSTGPAVNPGLDGSLVAAYAFNEQRGLVAADASGYGHLGQVSGAAWDRNGRYGGALAFDGIDDWVTIADTDTLDLTGGFTLSAWVNPTVLSGWRTVIKKERPDGLVYALEAHDNAPRPAAFVNMTAGDVATSGTSALPLDTWTHLATTFDGATLRLYVNGIEVGSTAVGSSIVTSTDPLRIGGNAVWNDEFFEGLIDEVRIHSTALTAADLQSAMALPIDATPVPNVVGLTQAAGEAALAAAGLIVGTVAQAASDSVPDGAVISQHHAAGASVAPGTAVALVVSTGAAVALGGAVDIVGAPATSPEPAPLIVPTLVALELAVAEDAVAAAGLTVGSVVEATSDTVLPGIVISQMSAAGSATDTGAAIDLVVSTGPAISMPDLVGLPHDDAETAIVGVGLAVGTITETDGDTVPVGSVVSQSPAAGSSVELGALVDLTISAEAEGPYLETTVISGTSNMAWATVPLGRIYESMVVVCTPSDTTLASVVVRVRRAVGNSFDVRLARTDGSTEPVSGVSVHCLTVEAGVYSDADHGVTMEATTYTSTVTDRAGRWRGEARVYQNAYTAPVVLGQVMSYNDAGFSTFWARAAARNQPPSSSALSVGKHVGEDPSSARADEIVGYIVIEAGSGSIGSLGYTAGVGADTVRGVGNSPPFSYVLTGLSSASVAIASPAGMDGGNGGWPVLYGSNGITASSLSLAFDEDQAKDAERRHTTEQVAYIVFE